MHNLQLDSFALYIGLHRRTQRGRWYNIRRYSSLHITTQFLKTPIIRLHKRILYLFASTNELMNLFTITGIRHLIPYSRCKVTKKFWIMQIFLFLSYSFFFNKNTLTELRYKNIKKSHFISKLLLRQLMFVNLFVIQRLFAVLFICFAHQCSALHSFEQEQKHSRIDMNWRPNCQ